MHNILIDNSSDSLSMATYLKKCLTIESINIVQIATGYWDLLAMSIIFDELSIFLEREDSCIHILIGKDPYVYTSMLENPKYKDGTYPDDFIRSDINVLEVKEEYKSVVKLLLKYLSNGKIQIRKYTKKESKDIEFLHSKCYIFSGENISLGIIGSSNFTQKGLVGNSELNYLETDPARVTARPQKGSVVKGHICWFEEKWSLSEDWNQEFLEQIIKSSNIYQHIKKSEIQNNFTPYEQYIKLLQLQFGDIIDKDLGEDIESYLPANMHKLNYQIDAVKRCISIMKKHGGFILADVVGLGKTIIATLIIKNFLSVQGNYGREKKVLIITPPTIQSSWKKSIALFDQNAKDKISEHIDFITTGRLDSFSEINISDENDDDIYDIGEFNENLQNISYGLILIDESHKFRNSNTLMYQSLDKLIKDICLKTNLYPYIGLLSATPQNNHPNDLKNQIYLFERNHTESTLKKANGGNLESFFADISREYDRLISNYKENKEPNNFVYDISKEDRNKSLNDLFQKLRDCVLSDILERRTRIDIEKYYKEDMETQGLRFPRIIGPNNLEYIMDKELIQLFDDTMRIIAPTEIEKLQSGEYLQYLRYRAIEYFKDAKNEKKHTGRGNLSVNDISKQLASIMQVLLVKRLESSFTAFTNSLLNLRRYTENMIKMWDNDTIFICPQIDVNKELDYEYKSNQLKKEVSFNDCIHDIRRKIEKLNKEGKNEKGQNSEYKKMDFKEEYYELLKKDYEIIKNLYDRWAKNSQDPKLDTFKDKISTELFNTEKNTSKKLVIFSEAIDTVEALRRAVEAKNYKALIITAKNRNEKEQIIEENFDANYTGVWKDDYDVIITTEVLAEGINLHRANVILNYDTPWNSTRLMQRIGRVNRIGSKAENIYVYNFMPSAVGDAQIQLVRKAHTKLQSFHILFGEDSKIFSEEESLVHYDLIKYDNNEESPMQKYIYKLKQYKIDHPNRYQQIENASNDWQIAQIEDGTAYFVVEAPKYGRLAIKISQEKDKEFKTNIIKEIDLLEELEVDENTKSIPLPINWQELSDKAIKEYNQHFVSINKVNTKALKVINNLYDNYNESNIIKEILTNARILVYKGSIDLINQLLFIGEELNKKDKERFSLEEIEDILNQHISNLLNNVPQEQGEAKILLGTIK